MSVDRPDRPEWGEEKPDRPQCRDEVSTGAEEERWDPVVAGGKRLSEFELPDPDDGPDTDLRPECRNVEVPEWRRDILLYGHPRDRYEGGHLHGVGRPATTEFPADWGADKIIRAVEAVAREPEYLDPGEDPGQWWFDGEYHDGDRGDVRITGLMHASGHIWDAWPTDGDGVRFNEDPAYDGKIWE